MKLLSKILLLSCLVSSTTGSTVNLKAEKTDVLSADDVPGNTIISTLRGLKESVEVFDSEEIKGAALSAVVCLLLYTSQRVKEAVEILQ